MMLQNNILYFRRQMVLLRDQGTVSRMGCKDGRRYVRIGVFMGIAAALILAEISRALQFADIMIISTCTGQVCVGSDFVCSRFGKIRNNDGMMICPRSFKHQTFHQRLIRICNLQQTTGRCKMENSFEYRLKCYGQDTAEKASGKCPYACVDQIKRFIRSKKFDAGNHDKRKQCGNQS